MFKQTTAFNRISGLKKRIRIIQGGTSAGKTIANLLYLIAYAQTDKTPTLTSVVSESIPHLKRGAIRDFKKIMQEHHYWDEKKWNATDYIYTFETGSQLEFFSADNEQKLRGSRRDRLFINEANNVNREAFEQLEVRTKEFIIIDYNPTGEFWAQDIQNERDDCEFIILTYKDNEGLDENIIKSIEQRRSRADWWRVYGEGLMGEVKGKIYSNWTIIDEVPKNARLLSYGLDFGYTNDPTAIVAIYYADGGYIFDEVCYQTKLSNRQIGDIFDALERAPIIADSAEPKSIDELKGYGLNVLPSTKGKGSIQHGIQFVQDQKICVTKSSVNLIKEYRNYLWKVDRDGRALQVPEPGDDHGMDAIRYGLQMKIKKPVILYDFKDNIQELW